MAVMAVKHPYAHVVSVKHQCVTMRAHTSILINADIGGVQTHSLPPYCSTK